MYKAKNMNGRRNIFTVSSCFLYVNRVKFSDDVYSKVGELRFRFTELEDELKDGYITLKVRLFFLLYTLACYS